MKRTFAAAALALSALASLAFTQEGVLLKRNATVGDVVRYKMTSEYVMGENTGTVTVSVTEKVVEVKPNGEYVVDNLNEDAVAESNGDKLQLGDMPTITIRYSALGDLLDVTSTDAAGNPWRMSNITALRFSDEPVKVGDKWTHEVKSNPAAGVVALKADYEVVGSEKIGSADTLKIKMTLAETEGQNPTRNDGFAWVDIKTGTVAKSEWQIVNAVTQFGSLFNVKMRLERQ